MERNKNPSNKVSDEQLKALAEHFAPRKGMKASTEAHRTSFEVGFQLGGVVFAGLARLFG